MNALKFMVNKRLRCQKSEHVNMLHSKIIKGK